jgi:pimeloyl-ACP methyl ester carboxylesterase
MPRSISTTSDRWCLTFRTAVPANPPLPAGITRSYITTPSGHIELLSPYPGTSSTTKKPALLFQHGGFGNAQVWIPFMQYFSSHGYPCHAISLRGHGQSWNPGYLRMVFWTSADQFAEDVVAGIKSVERLGPGGKGDGGEGVGEVVLVGHSNGGGLVQMVCDRGLAEVGAVVLLSGTPNFGQ